MHARTTLALTSLAIGLLACGGGLSSADGVEGESASSQDSASGSSGNVETNDSAELGSDESTDSSESADSSETGDSDEPACDEFVYSLTITAETPLESLACLRETHDLTIDQTDWVDLSALPALEVVYSLRIHDNPQLSSLAGTALVDLRFLYLRDLPKLVNVGSIGLDKFSAIELGRGLNLLELGLPAGVELARIAFLGWDGPNIDVLDALELAPALEHFTIDLSSTPALVDLEPIVTCCAYLGSKLSLLIEGPELQTLSGLDGLTSLDTLELIGVSLPDLTHLEGLTSVNSLQIHDHCPGTRNSPISLTGLTTLTSALEIDIAQNSQLLSLAGLESVGEIVELRVWDNNALAQLGLPPSAVVTDLVEIKDNDALPQAEVDAYLAGFEAGSESSCGNGEVGDCVITRPCPQ